MFAGLEYYAEPADIWSCGIVLVALLAGGGCGLVVGCHAKKGIAVGEWGTLIMFTRVKWKM